MNSFLRWWMSLLVNKTEFKSQQDTAAISWQKTKKTHTQYGTLALKLFTVSRGSEMFDMDIYLFAALLDSCFKEKIDVMPPWDIPLITERIL